MSRDRMVAKPPTVCMQTAAMIQRTCDIQVPSAQDTRRHTRYAAGATDGCLPCGLMVIDTTAFYECTICCIPGNADMRLRSGADFAGALLVTIQMQRSSAHRMH